MSMTKKDLCDYSMETSSICWDFTNEVLTFKVNIKKKKTKTTYGKIHTKKVCDVREMGYITHPHRLSKGEHYLWLFIPRVYLIYLTHLISMYKRISDLFIIPSLVFHSFWIL